METEQTIAEIECLPGAYVPHCLTGDTQRERLAAANRRHDDARVRNGSRCPRAMRAYTYPLLFLLSSKEHSFGLFY